MHVLTKVFIVLNSILAVLLVPLVVVYAHNEDNYKAQLRSAQAEVGTAQANLDAAVKAHTARDAMQEVQAERLRGQIAQLSADLKKAQREVDNLETALATQSADDAARDATIARLTAASGTAAQISQRLIAEASGLRKDALEAEQESLKLTQELRDAERQLEVVDGARRRLEEQLTDLREENTTALRTILQYRQVYPDLPVVAAGEYSGMPDVDLTGSIINVRESDAATYVEINLGAKDGVKEGWKLIVSDGPNFLTDVKITKVDIDSSIGIIADADRGRVSVGNRVRAVKGLE